MYTRCPNCSSTFRITEDLLQVADGEVQCGACSQIFNALHALLDESGMQVTTQRSVAGAEPPTQSTAATGEVEGWTDETLEFNAPEQDWQRFFIAPDEPPPSPDERLEPSLGADFEALTDATGPAATNDGEQAADLEFGLVVESTPTRSVDEETADTDTWQALLRETEADDGPAFVIADEAGDDDRAEPLLRRVTVAEPPSSPPAAAVPPAPEPPPLAVTAAGEHSGEHHEEALVEPAESILDWGPPPTFTERRRPPPRHTLGWLAASVLAAVALAAQAAHQFRDTLAADPRLGGAVRAVYDGLQRPLYPKWPLDAYEIRGAKAIAENSAPGALDIVAEIAVTGRQPVGLPMVRVVLRDRWSNPLASGVFDADSYLAERPAADGTYAAGTLIPVAISLADPGTTAQGYEIDVCLPDRQYGLRCKAAHDPFRR